MTDVKLNIKIDSESSQPKYGQIVDFIIVAIEKKELKKGQRLPSINEVSSKLNLSRDTVLMAYKDLKERGIIAAKHGKGFYITSIDILRKRKIFLLFDAMNSYKETLYRSFLNNLGDNDSVDIYFHYYNRKIFDSLIIDNLGNYSNYVIMPHFNEDVSEVVEKIPKEKLLIIDKDIETLGDGYGAVIQNFEKDIYEALASGIDLLQKYSKITLVLQETFQFIPSGIINGFVKFCIDYNFNSEVLAKLVKEKIKPQEVYIVIADRDLINLIKYAKSKNLVLGETIGIISYDDTPLKEVLAEGITVISTDFKKMGKIAADLVKNKKADKIENRSSLIRRRSL